MAIRNNKEKCAKFREFWSSWMDVNIFEFKKGDGIAYVVLYIIIPVVVTAVSLSALPEDDTSIMYCYVTILISALNGMYDGANRWQSSQRTVRNTKIFIIFISNIVVSIYCFVIIMCILITKSINYRQDKILLVYFGAVIVSLYDAVSCFASEMALRSYIKNGDE